MKEIIDESFKGKIREKIKNMVDQLDVNHILFISNYIEDNKISEEELKEKFQTDKRFKVEVNIAYLVNQITSNKDLYNHLHYVQYEPYDLWYKEQTSLYEELNKVAERGENKYDLNSFFRELFDLIDKRVNSCNFNSWIKENSPPNLIGPTLLRIDNEYKPFPVIDFDLDKVKESIQQQFLARQNVLNELKFKLVKIYCQNLLVPANEGLPEIPYEGTKSEMFEILLLIERERNFNEFETFKAIFLKILKLGNTAYIQYRSEYNKRSTKYSFLKRVLKKCGDINESK